MPKKSEGMLGGFRALVTGAKEKVTAVKEISFEITEGEIVGFLGPNGAGKTTTIKMLTGILYPSGGRAEVLGFRPFDRSPELLSQIALMMGNKTQLWWDLPATATFEVNQALYNIPVSAYKERLAFLSDRLQVADKMNTQVRKLSLGERMKCQLIAALLHQPRVLFLDEPTIGLDVVSQVRIREFLKQVNEQYGTTILLTSHYMADVAELCQRIIIVDHGTKVFDGSLDGLTTKHDSDRRLKLSFTQEVIQDDVARFGKVLESDSTSAVISVAAHEVPKVTSAVLAALPVADIGIEQASLEDVIHELFGERTSG
ncbi:MAG: ATP-binding cassette domain-containing protein [Armatimonadetes bacterium]|nr:ATP-binding cassette domain-containing protein [Armatimonadota bacterium]